MVMVEGGECGGKPPSVRTLNGGWSGELRTRGCSRHMALHLDLGGAGEQVACHWLQERGFTLLHRNWRHGRDELELVMRHGKEVVVVEVKTRSSARHGDPEDAVGPVKQRKLVRAAEAYLEAFDLDLDLRFDIVSVVMDPAKPTHTEVFHIPEAFYPTADDEAIEK